MANQTIFERHEKKYLLDARQFSLLYPALLEHLLPDQYGRHTICSLYFDTALDECAYRQINKAAFREKLRLRSYGVPSEEDTVYLELKKKYDGITYKRRAPLTLAEAQEYMARRAHLPKKGQILEEIDWFMRQNNPLPKTVICYDRIALYGKEDESLRITFDENIRYRDYDLDLMLGDHGKALCEKGQVLMEIKITGAMQLWLAKLLCAQGIYATSFSKFRRAYEETAPRRVAQPSPAEHRLARPAKTAQKEVLRHA